MSDTLDTIINSPQPIRCPACGTYCSPADRVCSSCQADLTVPNHSVTYILTRPPVLLTGDSQGNTVFSAASALIIQVLPSGNCITHDVREPIILGRGRATPEETEVLDLSDYHAYAQGVSRHHCLLERLGDRLAVTDLGSANGTYLNDLLLQPYEQHLISNGDKMILGRLHLTLFF